MAALPLSARVCMWFTYIQIAACVFGHAAFDIGPRFAEPDPKEIATFASVRFLLIPVLVLESCFMCYEMLKKHPRPNVLIMSRVVIWEMCVKLTYYGVLTRFNGWIVHLNTRASGAPRPIYLARWLGWSFAIPTVLTMANHPLMDDAPFSEFFSRIFPMLAATWGYCWSGYLGCVLLNPWMGWFLIWLACVAYLAIIVDQVIFFMERFEHTDYVDFKGFILIIRECVFIIYTIVWLLGNWDYVSSYWCELTYSYGDITLKCTFACLLAIFRTLPRSSDLKVD